MSSPRLRAFVIAVAGMALGIAIAKLSGASLISVIAVVLGLLTFVLFQARRGR